ncbi:MAG: hypothetical protein ACE5GO_08830 [Anaerolineales bacterium]
MLIRIVASEVPKWQIVLSQVFLWGSIVLSMFGLRWLLRRNLVSYLSSHQRLNAAFDKMPVSG